MVLKTRIQEDVKNALRAHERERLGVLRLITAAIKQKEVDERIELNDEQVLAETRRREFYEKPTQERKRKAAAAVKRNLRRMSREVVRRIRLY